jgi:DNA invertase Pin-like site-specific DNA recombinase
MNRPGDSGSSGLPDAAAGWPPRRGLGAADPPAEHDGRQSSVDPAPAAVALARRERGESVTAIASHLGIGRSTLYRALAEA